MAGRYNSEKHNRRSIRLKGYDYAQSGAYFVTICTQNRECLFGNIEDNDMVLNNAGEMVYKTWNHLMITCPGVAIDEFIVMPNHIHGIICIAGVPVVGAPLVGALSLTLPKDDIDGDHPANDRAGTRPAPTSSLGDIVGMFKSIPTHEYVLNVKAENWHTFPGRLWQRNYYERIIRNETELNDIRQYIINNPSQWNNDENNPENYLHADL